ncbi:lipid particle protein [Cryptococcus gattii Ru294]|nr:lipid particle protein [Cryptococcus gattii Ru294]
MISQHYGIPRYILCWLGARIMSRSGEQLYVVDKYSDDDPRPLLEIMADPRSVFYHGLEMFERLSLFAAAINDNSVPYPTAAIETIDHFAQWQDQRLVVDYNEAGIIRSWSREQQDYPPDKKVKEKEKGGRVVKKSLGTLARQSLDTSRSKRRLQQLAQTSSAPTPSPSGLSIQHLRATIRHIERNLESEFIESIDGPPAAAAAAAAAALDIYHMDQVVIKAQLKECQFRMALWLNQLPFKKYLTWWPKVTNAHATAIVRDAHLFPQHERGRGMLKFWAQVMLGQATDVS